MSKNVMKSIAVTHLNVGNHTLHNHIIWIQILVFLALFFLAMSLISKLPKRRGLDAVINNDPENRPIEDVQSEHRGDKSLIAQLAPLARRMNKGKGLKDTKTNHNIEQLIIYAGGFYNMGAGDLSMTRIILGGVFGVLGFLIYMVHPTTTYLFITAAAFAFGYFVPYMMLKTKAQQRQIRISKQIIDMCSLMKVAIQAGNTPTNALRHCAENLEGDLSDEIAKVYREIRVGIPRSQALVNLVERTGVDDLNTFVQMLNMQEQYGSSEEQLVETLDIITNDIRKSKESTREQKAQKATVKMLVPTVLFILPPMFLFIFGPAAVSAIMGIG